MPHTRDLTASRGMDNTLTLDLGRVYTVTSTGQGAGTSGTPTRNRLSTPRSDSLAGYSTGQEVKCLASMNGVFRATPAPGARGRAPPDPPAVLGPTGATVTLVASAQRPEAAELPHDPMPARCRRLPAGPSTRLSRSSARKLLMNSIATGHTARNTFSRCLQGRA